MMRFLGIFSLVVWVPVLGVAASSLSRDAGTSSSVFLRDGQGARAMAMGGAYTAAGQGVHSIFWNPAGAALTQGTEVTANYNLLAEDVQTQSFGFLYPVSRFKGALSVSALLLRMGDDIEQRDLSGNSLGDQEANAWAVSLGGGFRMGPQQVGFNLKRVREKLGQDQGGSCALDAGLQTHTGALLWGFSVRDLGTSLKIHKKSNGLPSAVRLGVAYPISGKAWLAMDLSKGRDSDLLWHWGGEYSLGSLLSLRLGYNGEVGRFDLSSGLSMGLGVTTRAEESRLGLDYAYMVRNVLDDLHRLSLTLQF
jgi:hypothetical protein